MCMKESWYCLNNCNVPGNVLDPSLYVICVKPYTTTLRDMIWYHFMHEKLRFKEAKKVA